MREYKAPWGKSLIIISTLSTILCVGVALGMLVSGRGVLAWLALLPLGILGGAALFTIRGYSVASDAILVHRLFWTTRLPLAGLQSARFEPNAMRRSIRTFGNGGLFSFTGCYRNKLLGAYRAFVTDPRRTVVLDYSGRKVVVSPVSPEEFIHDLPISSHSA